MRNVVGSSFSIPKPWQTHTHYTHTHTIYTHYHHHRTHSVTTKKQAHLGNTLRSFIPNVAGAWLFQKYAVMEFPATVAAAYGISPNASPNLGAMSGGLSPEGFLYGLSMSHVVQTLAALHTNGCVLCRILCVRC